MHRCDIWEYNNEQGYDFVILNQRVNDMYINLSSDDNSGPFY